MTTKTFRLPGVDGRQTFAAKQIRATRYRFDMIGIHTVADSAEMIGFKIGWKRSPCIDDRYTVRQNPSASQMNSAVSLSHQ